LKPTNKEQITNKPLSIRLLSAADTKMAADDLQLHGTLKGSSGKNLLMKKKRKIHIHAEKNAHRKKYSTETISLIGLAIVAILNVHLHFNRSSTTNLNPSSLLRIRRQAEEESTVVIPEETFTFTDAFEDSILPSNGTNTCSAKPVVFVKTHKTGGTTITNMILRHAERNNLLVGLPIQDHWELAGYPAKFDSRLIDPLNEKYDVLCHHFRFDESAIAPKVHDDSVYVTIMRNPISNYESIFGFFRDYPFSQWIGHNGTLKTFLSDPAQYYDESTPWYFRAKNYMAFDLGFNNTDPTPEYTAAAIQKMDKRFDLVMITDRFEESIILMRDLLCMSEDDVIYLALKVRRETQSTELTQDEGLGINITWRVGSFATWFGPFRILHGPITWLTKICLARIRIGPGYWD
jgi:hypothetical protein